MNVSQHIAAVLGPTLIAVTVSEAINLRIWDGVHPTVVYLNGLLLLVGGLVIVTIHNHWQFDSRLLVTVSGWLLVITGAYRMFFPSSPQRAPGVATYAIITLVCALGVALSFMAFLRT
ncbi:hypothetical protein [Bauldia sp.]|uniref:hypothetical protein n=1 Tax=Bauldia sp. TaxID=2575872 RepID=UPI003BADAB74